MKYKIMLLILLIILAFVYFNSNNQDIDKMLDKTEDYQVEVTDYYIYGSHFNISGHIALDSYDNLSLVLKNNKEEINIKYELDDGYFYISDLINDGLDLNHLKIGTWCLLFKQSIDGIDKYYSLSSPSDEMEYYSVSDNGNKRINIVFDNYKNKDYVKFSVIKDSLPEDVYDITIDPGHGGIDVGAIYNYKGTEYHEADITLAIASLLKKELEQEGYKVLSTRDSDGLSEYGENGRSVLPNKYKTKLTLSLHLNSLIGMTNGGIEVYVPNDVDTTFAQSIADNIVDSTSIDYSTRLLDKLSSGVYYEYLSLDDIASIRQKIRNKGLKPYDIIDNTPAMYMIREVGGKATHAYVDDRNREDYNLYWDYNQTSESYLIEMGYINIANDLLELLNNKTKIVKALVTSIDDYLRD